MECLIFHFTGVYGYPVTSNRHLFWNLLRHPNAQWQEHGYVQVNSMRYRWIVRKY